MSSSSSQYFTQHQTQDGVVLTQVLNRCPPGTKVHVLCVGYLQADEGFMLRGANTSTMSNPDGPQKSKRRDLVMYVVLIDHPAEGLILFETGCGKDYPEVWGAPLNDIFARTRYDQEHELDAAIAKVGYNIKDVKMVIIGHLHLDHAGGLDKFMGTDVPIWVHKEELLSAFYSVSTGADAGVYLPHYMKTDFNWKTWDERTQDLAQGITMHHLPGHTEGLCGLQINLIDSGTYIFVSDHGHVKENIWQGIPQGWLARNHQAWFNSNQRLLMMEKLQKAKIIPGHDEDIAKPLFGKVLT